MSKAVITFNLKDRDEEMDFKRYIKSKDMAFVIWDILNVRKDLEIRFESESIINVDAFDAIDDFAKEISKILDTHNVDIEDLLD